MLHASWLEAISTSKLEWLQSKLWKLYNRHESICGQTDRQMDRQTGRQMDRQGEIHFVQGKGMLSGHMSWQLSSHCIYKIFWPNHFESKMHFIPNLVYKPTSALWNGYQQKSVLIFTHVQQIMLRTIYMLKSNQMIYVITYSKWHCPMNMT